MLKDKLRYIEEEIRLVRSPADVNTLLKKLPFSIPRLFGSEHYIETKVPLSIQLEPTNHCNLKCISCPRDTMAREKGYMDFELFKKVIDEASRIGVKYIHLYLHGEPLMHPDITKMIHYIKLCRLNVSMTTNGMLLDGEKIEAILHSGMTIADYITISILGVSKEVHEKVMRGVNHDRVISNLENLISLRKRNSMNSPLIQTVFYEMPENSHEANMFRKEWKNRVDHARCVPYISQSYAQFNKSGASSIPLRARPCTQIWERMTILWNGDVTICCEDVGGDYIFGNIDDSPMERLWNSDKLRSIRNLHKLKKFAEIKICKRCDI